MIEVILQPKRIDAIYLSDVPEDKPIFVKKYGRLFGKVVKEKEGWIVRKNAGIQPGGSCGAYGHSKTREDCMRQGDYTYHIVSRKENNYGKRGAGTIRKRSAQGRNHETA